MMSQNTRHIFCKELRNEMNGWGMARMDAAGAGIKITFFKYNLFLMNSFL